MDVDCGLACLQSIAGLDSFILRGGLFTHTSPYSRKNSRQLKNMNKESLKKQFLKSID
jgi:hypothetical protein